LRPHLYHLLQSKNLSLFPAPQETKVDDFRNLWKQEYMKIKNMKRSQNENKLIISKKRKKITPVYRSDKILKSIK